ncbi:SGNH hydrolase-type esterase domain-containing protein [Lasiosphaeria ovina]|uniref:SGNH hydrolase-type esterase domain-containing protein n=1 Tax=Lasiosphaeria ovina TaxID=92902 RepID=A0AAE0KMD1_9PEZI|nr:SGNH hydrolase-type esterase domain-containing protein [Lasiosphaeria ovina]
MRLRAAFFGAPVAWAATVVLGRHDDGSGGQQQVLGAGDNNETARVNGFVAFGDSYSAGIGTRVENGTENACRQGDGAYPELIHGDMVAAAPAGRNVTLQFLSCTGATTDNVLAGGERSQMDAFNASAAAGSDFATLSIGGNDLGFFDVMNACVFHFYSFYSGTCQTALEAAAARITSPDFELRLGLVLMEILDKVRWEKRTSFSITVTGYARFFNADTEECDDMSLGVWWPPALLGGPKMHQSMRRQMNELVVAVNKKLLRVVSDVNSRFANPRVLFVDYDAEFDGHRFCEPGVSEPDYLRAETWFFLPAGPDNAQPEPDTDTLIASNALEPDSPLVDPNSCLPEAERSGDWGELALCLMATAKQRNPSLELRNDLLVTKDSMWYVPTYYGKTFHPRSLGHEAIRKKIYEVWFAGNN